MQPGQTALANVVEGRLEHLVGFRREARNEVSPEHQARPPSPHVVAKGDSLCRRMTALHALEDHVVTGLQRKMQVRHEPLLASHEVEQSLVTFGDIQRRQPQPRK